MLEWSIKVIHFADGEFGWADDGDDRDGMRFGQKVDGYWASVQLALLACGGGPQKLRMSGLARAFRRDSGIGAISAGI